MPPPVISVSASPRARESAETRGATNSGTASRKQKHREEPPALPDHRILVILMTMSETRSLAEAKAHLSELVARAGTEHERITVTVHGRPTAVLLAVEDLEALEETIAVLSDPALMHSLAEADAELARGEGEDQESLAAVMRARRATA